MHLLPLLFLVVISMRNWLMIILLANTEKLITGIQQWKAVVVEEDIIVDSCLLRKRLFFE